MPQYGPSGLMGPIGPIDGLARLSLVLGLAGICCGVTGPFAVLLGLLGINRINESRGLLRGKGLAVAGIVLGALETVAIGAGTLVLASRPR
jgi:hypothetical protein